jgi:hypothetical protein
VKDVETLNNYSVETIGKLTPIVSLFVVVSGILFTVGFFSVIGIEFITLFSFQEHLVFSLVSIPVLVFNWGIVFVVEDNVLTSANPKGFAIKVATVIFLFAIIFSIIDNIFFEGINLNLLDFALPVVSFIISLGCFLRFRKYKERKEILYCVVFYLVGIFSFGGSYARISMAESNYNYVIDGDVGVAVLRFGSEIILISSDKNRVYMKKRSSVEMLYRDKKIRKNSDFCFNLYIWKSC